jgi:PAS domain S-box-containing protein
MKDCKPTYEELDYRIKLLANEAKWNAQAQKALKEREELLRASEEKFRSISASAQDAIIMVDNEGNISYWNEAAERILGYSAQEALTKQCHSLMVPKRYHTAFIDGFSKFKTTGKGPPIGKTLEFEAMRKSGKEFPIEISLSALKIEDKWCATGILRDISERKRAEEALRESERKYRDMFENVSDFLYFHDLDGHFIETNLAAKIDSGYNEDELTNMNIKDLIPERYKDLFPDYLKEVIKKGKSEGLMKVMAKDGSEHVLEYRNSLVCDATGPIGVRGSARDITERKRGEAALYREKEKFRILAKTSTFGVSLMDKDHHYKYLNPKFVEIFGYTIEDIPTDREWFAKAIPDVKYRKQIIPTWINDKKESEFEQVRARTIRVTCKDGSEKMIDFRPVTFESGDQLVLYEHISERKRAEKIR